ncbi:MAG: hypothetical protein ACO1OB_05265 [Archangium sp.]
MTELFLRVARQKDELNEPAWAKALMTSLVTRVQNDELTPDVNQVVLLSTGIADGQESELAALAFTPVDGGMLAVPVTRDEAKVVREWSPSGLVDVLSRVDPRLVTQLDRPSLLQSPRARQLIEQRIDLEGSSMSSMTANTSRFTKLGTELTWKLSSDAVETLVSLLKGRIGHLRGFSVVSDGHRVDVANGDGAAIEFTPKVTSMKLSMVAARQLRAQLKTKPGSYSFEQLPGVTLQVV